MKTIKKIIIAIAVVIAVTSGHAQTTVWTLDGEGNWFSDQHWSDGVPTVVDLDTVIINNGGTAVIDQPGAIAKTVELGLMTGNGNLRIINGGTLLSNGTVRVGDVFLGSLQIGGTGSLLSITNVNGPSAVVLSNGFLTIGGFGGTAPGILDAAEIQGTPNDLASLRFSHNDNTGNYFFTNTGTSAGNAIHITGSTNVTLQDGTTTLTGNNTYTGNTNINGGTLAVSSSGNLGSSANLINFLNGATLRIIDTFAMSRSMNFSAGGGSIEVLDGKSLSFSGVISSGNDTGPLIKRGGGTLIIQTFSSSNTYSGGTVIEDGRITISASNNNTPLGTGSVTIEAGGALSGRGKIVGDVTVAGELSPSGALPSLDGLFDIQADLTITSTGIIQMSIGTAGGGGTWARGVDYDAIDVAGTFLINTGATLSVQLVEGYAPAIGDSFDLFNAQLTGIFAFNTDLGNGLQWDITQLYTNGVISVTAIPEPSTWLLLGLGVMGCTLARKKNLASISHIA